MIAAKEITEFIGAVKSLCDVGVCFYDTENFFRYNAEGKRENVGHYCEFCRCAKLLENGQRECDRSDRLEAPGEAQAFGAPFFFRCHMGLCEMVVPVLSGEKMRGVLFLGQCRIEGEDAESEVYAEAERLGGDGGEFVRLYRELPVLSREKMNALGDLFRLYFARLGDDLPFPEREISPRASDAPLSSRVASYIDRRYQEDLSSSRLAARFFITPSYLARMFRENYGVTVTAYIRTTRMKNAKRLLASTRLPVSSISLNVGYTDANYFYREFRRETGMTPSEYRQRQHA